MIPKEIIKKVRHIEIRTQGLVNDLFGGEYHSVFKGRGMTFSEVREYIPGDDIRTIDWNVTARMGNPYVKIFEEERELTVILMVDVSGSGEFGTGEKLKNEIGAEIAAVLGFSAIKNQDKVGVILFSDHIEKYIPPKKGRSHVLRVVRELLFHKSKNHKTSISNALDFLLKVTKRKSVVFLISDFIDNGYWKNLNMSIKKHDVIGIHLYDMGEMDFPNLGFIKGRDPETGKEMWLDTHSKKNRAQNKEMTTEFKDTLMKKSKKKNFDLISIPIAQDYVEPLMTYFKQREKRR
jgi:uncharacterized protein (DUF58 family)